MQPHARFTALFWAIGNLVDDGKTDDITRIQDAIAEGTLFDYLRRT